MTPSERYVAAAYLVVFLAVLVYVLIISTKVSRLEREVEELERRTAGRAQEPEESGSREQVEVG